MDAEAGAGVSVRDELERFVYDNPDLERLEAILDDFNPFTAMRWTRQEARHSSFLRWLLDPSETHGLGAYFLRSFLKRVARESEALDPECPSVFDVDGWELGDTQVLQEWQNIDLLIRNDREQFVVVVENKVHSSEHSEQLQKYRALVEKQFPGHRKLFAFLTIGGDVPSDETYVPIGHAEVAELVDTTLGRRQDQLSSEVRDFLRHYVQMVRRHIVEDSEIQKICQAIYENHQRALDVLFEHRPDRASTMNAFLVELVANEPDLIPDHSSKAYIRFIPKSLDFLPRTGSGWTKSGRLLLFELENLDQLRLKVAVGPGPQQERERLRAFVENHPKLFNRADQRMYPKWWTMHVETWLTKKQYSQMSDEEIQAEARSRFDRFVAENLPKFCAVLGELEEHVGEA